MINPTEAKVSVEQSDREAAADLWRAIDGSPVQHVLDGLEDDTPFVQVVAYYRHNLAPSETPLRDDRLRLIAETLRAERGSDG